jgi:hypothetical protein
MGWMRDDLIIICGKADTGWWFGTWKLMVVNGG